MPMISQTINPITPMTTPTPIAQREPEFPYAVTFFNHRRNSEYVIGRGRTIQDAADRYAPESPSRAAVNFAANVLAVRLQDTNPRFDRERFLRACVPGANVRARSK